MDSTAVNHNITIDDFDSIISYSDQSQWTTPDPSAPTFPLDPTWLRGTYHNTTVKGAEFGLNFTGPAIYIYGATGPAYGSYEVVIDNQEKLTGSAFRQSTAHGLLFSTSELTYANHNIVLRNLGRSDTQGDQGGDALVLDYILSTVQLAPSGATVQNVTFEETNPAIKYSGTWGDNTGPVFSGGGTTYTNEDGAAFEFTFEGTALYILGDKKNDHRAYTVILDSQSPVTYNGTSGCGGAYGLTCEQQVPCIKYMASNLAQGEHTVRLVNNANGPAQNGERSFFDLDSIVVTVPSQYAPRQLTTGSSSPFVSQPASPSPSPSGTSPTIGSNGTTIPPPSNTGTAPNSLSMMSNPLLLLVLGVIYILRPWSGAISSRR